MFLNFSNHPSVNWSDSQLGEAGKCGEIKDLVFPNIPADYTKEQILTLVDEYINRIKSMNPDTVMCQGEFTFTFNIVNAMKKEGIRVVSACSERRVKEYVEDGVCKKKVEFVFAGFREY